MTRSSWPLSSLPGLLSNAQARPRQPRVLPNNYYEWKNIVMKSCRVSLESHELIVDAYTDFVYY